jgi:phospholipase/carboxylesterase
MITPGGNPAHRSGRLHAVPTLARDADTEAQAPGQPMGGGLHWPFGAEGSSAALFVPSSLPDAPVPLVVLLHGAGSHAANILSLMEGAAEEQAFLVLAPQSVDSTWDVIRGGFGDDVARIDAALNFVFDAYPVDPGRIAIAGFSDGASYALSLGLVNGSLFSRILAFSPGFVMPGAFEGSPSVFISHGVSDQVLPIDRTSRRIVPALQAEGYDVNYREFDSGHIVPPDILAAALERL